MNFFLEINAYGAVGADDHIGANASVGWNISARICDSHVGWIVSNRVMGALDRGRD